ALAGSPDRPSFPTRRSSDLGFGLAFAGAAAINLVPGLNPVASAQAAVPEVAQRIADHFSSVRTMAGEFVQFGPNGEQTGGKFFRSEEHTSELQSRENLVCRL